MTTERINLAATARDALSGAAEMHRDHDDAGALAKAAIAQVYATLALVEQQRIENLIALVALSGNEHVQESAFDEGSTLSSAGMHALIQYERTPATPISDPDDVPVIQPWIQAALGLEVRS